MASFITTKFVALATVLLVLVFVAQASIYRTIVTTTETLTEANDSQMEERCRQEVQTKSLDACRNYVQYGQRSVLMIHGGGNQGSVPRECCQPLGNVKEECRCEALEQMVQEQQQQQRGRGQGQEQQQEEVVRRAENVPSMCHMKPHSCQIRGRPY